jgi:CRP-like cAMP-binding protein
MRKRLKAKSSLGNIYSDGEYIVRQGEPGNCMYEIQEGDVEVVMNEGDREIHLGTLRKGDFFGEMALFERTNRSASIRASGEARVITIDKRIFFGRVSEDPTLAFRILEKMSNRIRQLDKELMDMKKKAQP